MTWASDDRLVIQWLKRLQNHLILQTYKRDGASWTHEKVRGLFLFCQRQNKVCVIKAPLEGKKSDNNEIMSEISLT